jgi:hypothetical protein
MTKMGDPADQLHGAAADLPRCVIVSSYAIPAGKCVILYRLRGRIGDAARQTERSDAGELYREHGG